MCRTVVLCGSLGAPSAMWEAQLPALAGRETLCVDHPGHGGAPVFEVHDVGDLARHVLAAAGDRSFAFVGLSLGGAVGMRLALDAPDRVERLVLACTAMRFGDPAQWLERAATVRAQGLGAIVDAVLARWFTPGFEGVDVHRERFLNTDPEGYARCCEALSQFDVRDRLGSITAPTLAIAATEDPSTPPGVVESVAHGIPGARFEVIGDAAHLVNVERPDAFNRLLEEHL
ncbi:MAG TPA: alpha/beta fold hydrolase [Gaiellaceae bacterium]